MKEYTKYQLRRTFLRKIVTKYRHKEINPEDFFIASYPKSGNTWLSSMLSTALLGRRPDREEIHDLVPYVGYHKRKRKGILANGGRLIKTHEPYFSEYKNAIYIFRDWKEVAVSYWYFERRNGRFNIEFEKFLQFLELGLVNGYGNWAQHLESWLNAYCQNKANIVILTYENLSRSPEFYLNALLKKLEIAPKISVPEVIELNSREEMKKDDSKMTAKDSSIPFVRSSGVGENFKEFYNYLGNKGIDNSNEEALENAYRLFEISWGLN